MMETKKRGIGSALIQIFNILKQIKSTQIKAFFGGLTALLAVVIPLYFQQHNNHLETQATMHETQVTVHKTDSAYIKGRAIINDKLDYIIKSIDSLKSLKSHKN